MRNKWTNLIKIIRALYLISLVLTGICLSLNIYRLIHPHFKNLFYTIVITTTPLIVLVYLLLIIVKRRKSSKKSHEQRKEPFSKN